MKGPARRKSDLLHLHADCKNRVIISLKVYKSHPYSPRLNDPEYFSLQSASHFPQSALGNGKLASQTTANCSSS